ncbi:MAG: type II secretion system protein [Campylobacterota bacterium]|nr:type II secretion system protein [Campylobacterota bacterium]
MKCTSRKGFSLIEIGIVMVVIGLIIAAVMKGKDVIKSAEMKEITQNFMSKWVSASDTYYDKLGYNPYGHRAKRMIGGQTTANVLDVSLITETNVTNTWKNAGIDVKNLIKTDTGDPTQAYISGEFTEDSNVHLTFGYVAITDENANTRKRNVVIFTAVPVDVAKAFDKLTDSIVDGTAGKVVTDGNSFDVGDAHTIDESITIADWADVEENKVTDVYIILEH